MSDQDLSVLHKWGRWLSNPWYTLEAWGRKSDVRAPMPDLLSHSCSAFTVESFLSPSDLSAPSAPTGKRKSLKAVLCAFPLVRFESLLGGLQDLSDLQVNSPWASPTPTPENSPTVTFRFYSVVRPISVVRPTKGNSDVRERSVRKCQQGQAEEVLCKGLSLVPEHNSLQAPT
jgi:hypothetical protein